MVHVPSFLLAVFITSGYLSSLKEVLTHDPAWKTSNIIINATRNQRRHHKASISPP